MNKETIKKGWWSPIRVGLVLSGVFLIGFVAMALQRNCILLDSEVLECRSNLTRFLASRPNEIGDTLAGFAGTLAFIWIVITVWLQSSELAEQREVLRLTRDEIEGQRVATQDMARSLAAQAAIFEEEGIERRFQRVERQLDARLLDLLWQIEMEWQIGGCFEISQTGGEPVEAHFFFRNNQAHLAGGTADEKLRDASKAAFLSLTDFQRYASESTRIIALSEKRGYYEVLVDLCNDIVNSHDHLAEDQKIRLSSLGMYSLIRSLDALLELPIWAEET